MKSEATFITDYLTKQYIVVDKFVQNINHCDLKFFPTELYDELITIFDFSKNRTYITLIGWLNDNGMEDIKDNFDMDYHGRGEVLEGDEYDGSEFLDIDPIYERLGDQINDINYISKYIGTLFNNE